MKSVLSTTTFVRYEQGFQVYVLQNESLEIGLVPELGAKIISLVNRRTGREWMNHPAGGMKLFRNQLGDDFAHSTLTGWDECLPTIAPCVWKDRKLPDHGEVWSVPWSIDREAFDLGVLKTSVTLAVSPFHFMRSIVLHKNEVQLYYKLENLSVEPEKFLWAMHPLVPIYPGDAIELTDEMRESIASPPWLDSLEFGTTQPACAKVYAGPLGEGLAGIFNSMQQDRLLLKWDAMVNNTLGVWLTRGGWNGHHHLALEPSNGWPDALADSSVQNQCGTILPHSKLEWRVTIQVEPATAFAKLRAPVLGLHP
jgi:hypothetical protein